MSNDVSPPLVLTVDATQLEKGAVSLAQLAQSAGKAETAADGLADSSRDLSAAEAAVAAEAQRAMSATNALGAATNTAMRYHQAATTSAKLQSYQLLNLGRQFTDVGVSIASGSPIWMVAIQQGAQIGEVFAEAKTQGVSLKAALGQIAGGAVDMAKKFAPLLGTGAVLGAVALAAYGVWKEIEKTQKAMKDLESATMSANVAVSNAREAMKEASLGAGKFGVESLGAAFGIKKFGGEVGDAAVKLYDFAAASKAASINGLMAQRALLATKIGGLEERGEQGRRGALTGAWTPARIAGKLGNRIGGDLLSLWTGGESDKTITTDIGKARDAMKELEKATVDAGNADPVKWADEARAALGDLSNGANKSAKAIKANAVEIVSLTDGILAFRSSLAREVETMGLSEEALKKREVEMKAQLAPTQELADNIRMLGAAWLEGARVAKQWAEVQAQVKSASNDNIRTFAEQTKGQVHFSSQLEIVAADLENASRMSSELRYGLDDVAYAINNNDWTSAFAGLARVLSQVQLAFKNATTEQERFNAVAMAANAVGGAVGGTGGAAISGAASGAMAGFTVGGPIGAVVGGVIGGALGIFGSSKAKKKARQQAAAQAAADEAQRVQTIADTGFQIDVDILRAQGKEVEAVAKEREKELAALTALSPALAASKKAYYDTIDAATAAAKAADDQAKATAHLAEVQTRAQSIQDEIDKLTMSDVDLLAKTRARERAEAVALDPALSDLIDKLYGLQDAATATADAATQAAAQQEAMAQAVNDNISRSIKQEEERVTRAAAAQEALNGQMTAFADSADRAAHSLDGAIQSLTAFADSLKAELGLGTTGGGLQQARSAFNTAVATGNYDAIPELGKAYAEAAKNGAGSQSEYLRVVAQIRQASLNSATAAKSSAYQSSLSKQLSGAYYLDDDAMAAEIRRLKAAGLPAAANGGSFMVGGNGGTDNNLMSINGVPAVAVNQGEVISVTPRGASNDNSYAELVAEMRALRQQVADLQSTNRATANQTQRIDRNIDSVTEGGNAMLTEAV